MLRKTASAISSLVAGAAKWLPSEIGRLSAARMRAWVSVRRTSVGGSAAMRGGAAILPMRTRRRSAGVAPHQPGARAARQAHLAGDAEAEARGEVDVPLL